jgi:hypothetical protein
MRNHRIIIKQQDARMWWCSLAGGSAAFRHFFLWLISDSAYVLFHCVVSPQSFGYAQTQSVFIVSLTITTHFKFWQWSSDMSMSCEYSKACDNYDRLFSSFIMSWQISRHFQELRKMERSWFHRLLVKNSFFGEVYSFYHGQSIWCNLKFIIGSDAANQKELIALFFMIYQFFSGGGQSFEVPNPNFSKQGNQLVELCSLCSIPHVLMIFEGSRCLCQLPKFSHQKLLCLFVCNCTT